MRTVSVTEAKARLTRLLEEVAAGEEIVIALAGRPMARLVAPVAPVRPRRMGLLVGKGYRVGDDFETPLPDDLLDGFSGKS